MTEIPCTFGDDRDGAIVAFLYDDTDESLAERQRFETHLPRCARCQTDVAALRGVRAQLARWSPPEPVFAISNPQSNPQSAIHNPQWWRQVPMWAQVAAALLFLGVSAGIANLDVRYDQSGLSVRTGWSSPSRDARVGEQGTRAGAVAQTRVPESVPITLTQATGVQMTSVPATGVQATVVADQHAPWRADLDALERQLKTEFRAAQASSTAQTARAASTTDGDVSRVRVLLQDSEKRQQRELALRIAELLRDVNVQRQADMAKIDRTLGVVTNNVGVQVMKNRQEIDQMNLLYRASQRQ
jgi:hypothetical protein